MLAARRLAAHTRAGTSLSRAVVPRHSASLLPIRASPLLQPRRHMSSSHFARMDTPINLGVVVVPQQMAWVVERFGKFHTVLEPGLRFLVPLM